MSRETPPHIVIIGGGFGGLQAASRLKNAHCRVTMIDRRNHHLFQPLLYQVATGGLSPANIAVPLRHVFRKQRNCETLLAEATGFNLPNRKVLLADGEIDYDYLVLAAGAVSSYFGQDQWEENAPGLKSLDDAGQICMSIYGAFEAAEREPDPELRKGWLTFVVVGGGPTGVEMAGAIAEIARMTLANEFRHIRPADARVMLVDSGDEILSSFPAELRKKAHASLTSRGVEVHTGARVTGVEATRVHIKTKNGPITVPTWTVIWGAGVKANSLAAKLAAAAGVTPDRSGRIPVTPTLNIQGQDRVYAIGDIATCPGPDGAPLPGLGSVAMQQGEYVGRRIAHEVDGDGETTKPFRYHDLGTMATIGRSSAIAVIGKIHLSGFPAWVTWMSVHLMLLVHFNNRILVFIQWAWSYFTNNRSSRLILGVREVALPSRECGTSTTPPHP